MSLNSWMGWQGGANSEAADYAIKTGTPAKVNTLQKLFGATDEDAQNIVLKRQQERLNQQYGGTMAQLGLTGADWGETEQDVLRKISQRTEQRAIGQRNRQEAQTRQAEDRARQERTEVRQADRQMNLDTIASNERLGQQQLQSQQDKFAFTSKENNAVRAHEASERAKDRSLERQLGNMSNDMQMQMAFIERDIAAKQMEYDRETRRMDKRDAAIAQLMKGIGQLGGAFSL